MQNLSKFGHEFQIKLVTCLLTDASFSSRIFDILRADYFDSQALSWLCDVILKYYQQYHAVATIAVLKYEIDSIDDELLKEEVIGTLRSVVSNTKETDLQFIKDATIEFCRNQEIRYAIYEAVDLLKDGDFDRIKQRFDEALKKGEDKDTGHDYLEDVDDRYSVESRTPITTGWKFIDEITQGGLSGGELGVIVGNSGSGKSWCLSYMCAKALEAGHRALYVTLELAKTVVGVRIDCILTGIDSNELAFNTEQIKRKMSTIKHNGGNLIIEWYPTKKLSIIGLRALLDRTILLGVKPDILFLDYADLMKVVRSSMKRKDEELQELYEELRGIAGEYNIPVWTVSQANRSSHDKEVEFVDAGMIAESMGKHYTADFMMSLLRKESDKVSKTARFHVIKNRLGDDGISLLSTMNLRRGIIDIYNPKSPKHLEIQAAMTEDQVNVKQRLQDRHSKFFAVAENVGE